jgi:hypothetical protein
VLNRPVYLSSRQPSRLSHLKPEAGAEPANLCWGSRKYHQGELSFQPCGWPDSPVVTSTTCGFESRQTIRPRYLPNKVLWGGPLTLFGLINALSHHSSGCNNTLIRQTETDRDRQRQTETDRDRQRQIYLYVYHLELDSSSCRRCVLCTNVVRVTSGDWAVRGRIRYKSLWGLC